MLNNPHFYNRSIRKIVVAFGTIFNDIQLVRYTKDGLTPKETFKVPLSYGSKEKYLTRITSDPNLTKSVLTVLPRISFELTGMSYDADRKKQSTLQNFAITNGNALLRQYTPIPYNFDFSMSIYVRNTEDGAQIVEQILPFFTPDFTVSVDFIPTMNQKYDLPIMLNSVTNETTYEGDFMDTRLIIWNLEFTVKGYIFPPIKESANGNGLIKSANANFIPISAITGGSSSMPLNFAYNTATLSQQQIVTVDYANGSNYFIQNEIVRSNNSVFGTVAYFSNNSIGTLVLQNLNGIIRIGDTLTSDLTHSKYTVSDVSLKSSGMITVRVSVVPNTAGPDDEFGFAEQIIES